MVESKGDFPFRVLRYEIYLLLDIMMYIECEEILKFMFSVNKETRNFVQKHFIDI